VPFLTKRKTMNNIPITHDEVCKELENIYIQKNDKNQLLEYIKKEIKDIEVNMEILNLKYLECKSEDQDIVREFNLVNIDSAYIEKVIDYFKSFRKSNVILKEMANDGKQLIKEDEIMLNINNGVSFCQKHVPPIDIAGIRLLANNSNLKDIIQKDIENKNNHLNVLSNEINNLDLQLKLIEKYIYYLNVTKENYEKKNL
jgi:hypothetical protein